jgi:phage-related protein|nr:MAG TPA: tail tape measure protein [Caudoviricetes sp.]
MATQKADGSIYIKTEIDTTDAKASVKEITSLLKRLSRQVDSIGKSIKDAIKGGIKTPDTKGLDTVEEKAKSVADQIEKTAQAEKKLESIDIKSNALDTLDKAIETTGQKLAELEKAQMDVFNRNQSATSSPAFQAMESAASKLDQQYEQLIAKKKQLETSTTGKTGLPKTGKLTGGTGLASDESANALAKLNAEITGTETKVELLNNSLEQTVQAQQKISDSPINTTAYQILEQTLQQVEAQFNQVAQTQQELFARNQSVTSSPAFMALESAAEKLGRQYDSLIAKKRQLESGGGAVQTPAIKTAPMTGAYSATASSASQKALDALNKEITQTDAKEKGLVNTNSKLGSSFKNVSQSADSAKTKTGGISSIFSRMGGVVSGLGKRLAGLAQNFTSTTNSANNARFSIGRMVGMSILYSTVFGMISKVNSGIMTGINNLAQYSSATNASISSMMSALTQLQNSLATAFAPILSVVAPILTAFINMLSRAITYVGMFIAALTGQKSFTKAKAVQEDYAASLQKTSKSSNSAAKSTKKNANATKKANKEMQTYLSGLDEIRQYQKEKDNTPSSNSTPSTGGGGGGGYTGPSIGDMFEKVPIESSIADIAKKIKNLIKKEDWEGLGTYIASGINKGLQKIYDAINWNNVGPKITYFVNAFTRTFNSLVDHIDWNLMGRTVGAGINTIVNTLNLLIEGINWKNLGSKIATGINGLFNEVNWNNVGRLFANKINVPFQMLEGAVNTLNWAKIGTSIGGFLNGAINQIDVKSIGTSLSGLALGILTTLDNALTTTNWSQLGTKLATLLTSIDWVGIFVSAISVAGKAITALTQLGVSFMDNLAKGITNGTQQFISKGLSALTSFTANLRRNAGKLVDSGLNLMLNLAKGIANSLPDIIKNVPQIVSNIANTINDNAPKILMAGIQLIGILIKGLIQAIPTLIASIPQIIVAMVNVFTAYNWLSLGKSLITGIKNGIVAAKSTAVEAMTNTYNGLLNAIKNLPSKLKGLGENGLKEMGNGITGKLSGLKTTAGKILTNIIEAVKNLPRELAKKATSAIRDMKTTFKNVDWGSVGMNVVKGIAKGVGDFAWILVDKMTGLAQKAWEGVKDFFGIHSPSRLMRDTVGKMIPAGITVGLEKAFPDTIDTLLDQSKQLANVPFTAPYVASGAVIPAKASAVIAQKQHSTDSNNNDVLNLLEQLLSVMKSLESDNSGNNGGDYHFTAQINRRTLFDEFIEEAKLRQMSNGRNPFSLA